MSTLGFTGIDNRSLVAQIERGFCSVSIRTAAHGRPIAATFWHTNGGGLCIQSLMNDIAVRHEIGVLQFTIVNALHEDEVVIELPASFENPIKAEKLLFEESGIVAESGVILKAESGESVVVSAGAFPYTLALHGVSSAPNMCEPEYPLDEYKRSEIK